MSPAAKVLAGVGLVFAVSSGVSLHREHATKAPAGLSTKPSNFVACPDFRDRAISGCKEYRI